MMIDVHTHILPKIDDGSDSVEESLAMLAVEDEQGISCVVVTPHFYPQRDDPQTFLERRSGAIKALQEQRKPGMPVIIPGAEVYFYRGMSESEILRTMTIENTPYILIEMPMAPWPEDFYRELEEINRKQELIPIIAHIDRYISPLRTRGIPERLAQLPVLVQANAGSFTKESMAPLMLKLVREDKIHLLGSDCHNMRDRKPNIAAAQRCIYQKLGREYLAKMHGYERQVLSAMMKTKKAGVSL